MSDSFEKWYNQHTSVGYELDMEAAYLAGQSSAEGRVKELTEALKYHQEQTRPIQRTIDILKELEQ